MKVFVWAGGHTIAQSIFENPPDGVSVVSNVQAYTRRTGISGERMFVLPPDAKGVFDGLAYAAGLPRLLPSLPRTDLIHTVSGLVPIVPRPWMTSISMPSSFFGLHDDWHASKHRYWILRKILRWKECRFVTCFSKSTQDGLLEILKCGEERQLESKVVVLYPAIDTSQFAQRKRKDDGIFRVLFIGNHFFDKGGRELHRSVSRLAKKYDIRLDIVTDAPPHHKTALDEYMRNHQEEWTKWHVPGLTRRRLIEEFYPAADVFVMCSYMDPFGFVFIEAMASGLPIIGANVYAQREIVSDGENGYLIDVPISPFEGCPQLRTPRSVASYRKAILDESIFNSVVDQLTEKLTSLIEDSSLRKRMARASLKETTEGKFGLSVRNKRLKQMYQEALEQ